MRFTSVLKKLIVENSRFKVLYDKMVLPSQKALEKNPKAKGFMNFDILKQIIFADPDTKAPENFDINGASIDDMELVKVGKFTQWMLKHFVAPTMTDELKAMDPQSKEFKDAIRSYRELYMEDLFKMTEQLEFYEKVKQYLPQEQRDINKLTPADTFNIFSNFKLPEKKQKEIEKKQARKTREGFKHAGGQIIYEGDNWVVIKIEGNSETSKDAAIYYGGFKDVRAGESNWCTSGPGLTFFEGYIKNGPLYVIFPQNDNGQVGQRTGLPQERYQFHFPSNQFMDREDHGVDLVKFLSQKAPEIKELFKPEFMKGLIKPGTGKLVIDYPSSSTGKFVALYGFDELFDAIPETVTSLKITNSSRETIDFVVPDTISKFKSLESLVFDNFIKSLPESISQLSRLSILSLPNNKNLEKLPASLIRLEDLSFINLKNSNPNVIIPEELKEILTDQGDQFYYVG